MARSRWEVNVDDGDLRRMEDALEDGLDDGIRDALLWMARKGKEKGRESVKGADRIGFGKRVLRGFSNDSGVVFAHQGHIKIRNEAKHAEIVDEGLAPRGEHGPANPSVQDIIKWVVHETNPIPVDSNEIEVEEWDSDLQWLAYKHSPGYVMKAFQVRQSIEEQGYPGIYFTDTIETYLERVAPMVVERKIEKHMNKQLRRKGLK